MTQARPIPRKSTHRLKIAEACKVLSVQVGAVMPMQVWTLEWLFDHYDHQQRTNT